MNNIKNCFLKDEALKDINGGTESTGPIIISAPPPGTPGCSCTSGTTSAGRPASIIACYQDGVLRSRHTVPRAEGAAADCIGW